MSAAETDWQSFLSPDSDLPPDVFFQVKDEEGKGGQSKTIGAHRLILAGVSPVFRRMFFGPMKETGEVVEVNDTTAEAFDTMVKYIYHPPGGDPFNLNPISCPQKLFELLTLANKYQVLKLARMTSDALESLAITRENMIFTATVAKNYKEIFDDLSSKLTLKCLKFLYDTTSGGGDIFVLIKETVDNFPGANLDILRELIDVGSATLQLPGIQKQRKPSNLVVISVCNVFNSGCFLGWGSLVYFDTEEHQISEVKEIAHIPKLRSQWKIIHDFKPTEYLQAASKEPAGLVLIGDENCFVGICFPFQRMAMADGLTSTTIDTQIQTEVGSTQLPKVGEWTRIEIIHEKVDDKYFLSLSVGGREVGRKENTNPELRRETDVKVCIGHPDRELCQPGFIRRLVILEKR